MADLENLRTASLYINNQLLSRGLLRDGEAIDFCNPARNEGGTGAAMGRIMGIVNDLILRRDRDAEHRESLSTTLRTLRADGLRQTTDLARLTEKQAETERKLNISEASEASARAQLRSAEAAFRSLKEEMARVKQLVAQTRASCATEVRRRDRQIDGLKKQLGEATRSRGSVKNPAIAVISIKGDVGRGVVGPASGRPVGTGDPGYDLREETNEFLTELAKGLSEENEALSRLLRRMREELRAMSDWEREEAAGAGDGHAVDMTTNLEELESDLAAVLEHLRNILTNPSFVPLEEVIMREEEITRLRGGWVKMESRWKEAVNLIDGWRRRMATNGMPVDDEEMKLSLQLSPVRDARSAAEETAQAIGIRLPCLKEEDDEEEEKGGVMVAEEEAEFAGPEPPPRQELHDSIDFVSAPPDEDQFESDSESSAYDERREPEYEYDEEPGVEVLQQSEMIDEPLEPSPPSSPLPEPPQLSPLKDSSSAGNRGTANEPTPRWNEREYTTVKEEETCELVQETRERLITKRCTKSRPATSSHVKRQKVEPVAEDMGSSASSLDSILLDSPSRRRTRQRTRAAPRPRPSTSAREDEATSSRRATPAPEPGEHKAAARARRAPIHTPTRSAAPAEGRESAKRTIPRLSLPRGADPAPQQSPLTMAAIAAKLAASEREADAARVRAKLKAARMTRRSRPGLAPPTPEAVAAKEERDVDPVKRDVRMADGREEEAGVEVEAEAEAEAEVPVKRKREKRVSKVTSRRRRSTLSPWELESLISGHALASGTE